MNRLRVRDALNNMYTGGMPFDLEDIDWVDKAVREGFAGILSAFGVGYRISGCHIDPANPAVYQGGYLAINGEVFHVNAGAVPALNPGEVHLWAISVTHDPAGDEPFEDAVTHQTYEVRKAVLISGTPTFDRLPLNVPTLMEVIKNYMQANLVLTPPTSGWREVGAVSEPAFAGGWANVGGTHETLAFKSESGRVYFKGSITLNPTSATGVSTVFTLPTGCFPGKIKCISLTARYLSSNYSAIPMQLVIQPNGEVSIFTTGSIAEPSLVIGLDGLFFDQ